MTPRVMRAPRTYQFKVEFSYKWPLWRIVEVHEDQTLERLHVAIQGAFDWDNDHPYLFSLERRRTERFDNPEVEYIDPRVDCPFGKHSADDAPIALLGLRPRRKFRYLFDFGDRLLHRITVVKIGQTEPGVEYPRLIEKHGENAPQYSLWT